MFPMITIVTFIEMALVLSYACQIHDETTLTRNTEHIVFVPKTKIFLTMVALHGVHYSASIFAYIMQLSYFIHSVKIYIKFCMKNTLNDQFNVVWSIPLIIGQSDVRVRSSCQ